MSPPNPPGKKRQPLKEAPPPVIIIKRARHNGGHHGGAWKVAYADFVTTMMALFIVLWAASQSPNIRQSIASYFRNPAVVPSGGAGSGVLPASTGVVAQAEADSRVATEDQRSADARSLEQAAQGIRLELEKDPELRSISSQVRIEVTPEGLRIQLVERDESLFFEIGSAQVKPALTRVLEIVAGVVGRLPNDVTVEGHTDARQYAQHRFGYSNWELSADRANSARRVLESSGLRPRQVTRVVGYADHDLLVDDALDAQNRRVSVIVKRLQRGQPESPVPPVTLHEGLGQMKAATDPKR